MKKTQRKDALRNIRKRIVSFLSLCLVVALGLGALLITRYMGAGLNEKFSTYFRDRSFKDFEMVSSLGISENNLAKIRRAEGVSAAEGVMKAEGSISFRGMKRNAEIISLTKDVSVPELVEGSIPTLRGECMIGEDTAEIEGLKVGDTIGITLTGLEALGDKKPLFLKEFKITGLMHHPDYFRRKSVNTVVLPASAFDEEVTKGLYTGVFIKTDVSDADMFSEKYFEETADVRNTLTDLSDELADDRTHEVKDEAYAEIDRQWKEAEEKLANAEDEIGRGEDELAAKLAEAERELHNAEETLAQKIAEYKKKIEDAKKQLQEYKDKKALADKNLPRAEKYLKDMLAYYDGELKSSLEHLAKLENMLAKLDEIAKRAGTDSEEYKAALKELGEFISSNEETIRKVHSFFCRKEVLTIAEEIKEATEGQVDLTGIIKKMRAFDIETLFELSNAIASDDLDTVLDGLRDYVKGLRESLDKYNQYLEYIEQYKANQKNLEKMLADKEKEIADAEAQLEAERAKYQAEIDNGWARYYSEKAKYEAELEEAKALLAKNREEAEAKLKEARAEVDKIEPAHCVAMDRRANSGYVDARANLSAIKRAGNVFGLLFMIVTAIVCLSTLIIIIEEQKVLVGTAKAFGFKKGEVLGKYLSFGAAASLLGSLLALLGSMLLSNVLQDRYADSGMYQVGAAKSIVTPGITAGASVLIIAVTVAASVIACSDVLKSPASVLMKGGSRRKSNKKKKEASAKAGSLYSRLIMRNMADDKARVLVTVAIIAFCCMLIGLGLSMKMAYVGMMDRQISDVNKYDFRMKLGDEVTDEQEAKLTAALNSKNASYLPATVETLLYQWEGKTDGLQLICADPDKIQDYYAVSDPKSGAPLEIPADGVLIQNRMNESYNMKTGDSLPIYDTGLKQHEAEIKGMFTNYVGRTVVASPAAYKSIFGKEHEINTYYVLLNGADSGKLQKELLSVTENISFSARDEFRTRFESVALLYNILVVLITGIAVLISFMILTNLANIAFNRRKTELSVMRVNGFSIAQAKGYLRRETIITTLAGLILGVLLGALIGPFVIGMLEQPDLEFVKSFHPVAWIIAAGLEAVFAIVINAFAFNKVKKLNLRDIA